MFAICWDSIDKANTSFLCWKKIFAAVMMPFVGTLSIKPILLSFAENTLPFVGTLPLSSNISPSFTELISLLIFVHFCWHLLLKPYACVLLLEILLTLNFLSDSVGTTIKI